MKSRSWSRWLLALAMLTLVGAVAGCKALRDEFFVISKVEPPAWHELLKATPDASGETPAPAAKPAEER